MEEIFTNFIGFIKGIINYITELVAYFRAKNDGKEDVEMPTFPSFGNDEAAGE